MRRASSEFLATASSGGWLSPPRSVLSGVLSATRHADKYQAFQIETASLLLLLAVCAI
jgi:hypothetical protein